MNMYNCPHFLDLNLHLGINNVYTDIDDKRTDFTFKCNAFTDFKSCLYMCVYRNVILNHLYRIKNLCSSKYKLSDLSSITI